MDWRAKVELFEQIRLEYEFGVGTIQGVSRKLRVHRRVVREAIQSAIPARRKKTERPHVKMALAAEFIDAILEADRKAPRIGDGDLGRAGVAVAAVGVGGEDARAAAGAVGEVGVGVEPRCEFGDIGAVVAHWGERFLFCGKVAGTQRSELAGRVFGMHRLLLWL